MAPKTQTAPATEETAVKAKAFTLLGVNATVAMPATVSKRRGAGSMFPFAELQPGFSFGLIGRTAKSMSAIVSNQNRAKDNQAPKLDTNGQAIFKTKKIKSADGTETTIPTLEPETVWIKEFFAADVDPATDPEGATVRVFRKR